MFFLSFDLALVSITITFCHFCCLPIDPFLLKTVSAKLTQYFTHVSEVNYKAKILNDSLASASEQATEILANE